MTDRYIKDHYTIDNLINYIKINNMIRIKIYDLNIKNIFEKKLMIEELEKLKYNKNMNIQLEVYYYFYNDIYNKIEVIRSDGCSVNNDFYFYEIRHHSLIKKPKYYLKKDIEDKLIKSRNEKQLSKQILSYLTIDEIFNYTWKNKVE